eukprot:TRINITY_DN8238_c0_g1_i1.p1 TRINITY_DN8238_c0_g1~~TRINITY_DN8238_c0_g1_i1.p1  ORF type:complete len:239 (+),score=26.61 TRINITY_DN8238_c0_g1_i1:328-1044(+)
MNEKFSFFGDSQNSIKALANIKDNLEIVQTCLGQIEGSLRAPTDETEVYVAILNQVNNALSGLKAKPGVSFTRAALPEATWLVDPKVVANHNTFTSCIRDWCFGVSSVGITEGKVDFQVDFLSISNSDRVMVGFAGSTLSITSNFGANRHFGNVADGWGFYSAGGLCTRSGIKVPGKAPNFETGSTVIVSVDMDSRTVGWYHNGDQFASMKLPESLTKVHPAFCLYNGLQISVKIKQK